MPRRNASLDQLMRSRASWKKLEALSNQESSPHCYPFNYVVWVSTVVIVKAGWGHAGGGFCSWSACVCVFVHVSVYCNCGLVWRPHTVCVCVCAALRCWFVLLKCVCESEQLQMCSMFKCVYCLFVVHQRLSLVCVIHSFSRSEPSEMCLCIQPQSTGISEWLYVFLSWLYVTLFTLFSSIMAFSVSLSSFSVLYLHLSSLLLFPSLCSLSRWQAILGHRNRLPSDRCSHLS